MRDVIEMAREAGFAIDVSTDPNSPPSWWAAGHDDRFKAFESLVRADEREQAAAQRQWVGLTIGEIQDLIQFKEDSPCALAEDVEAKLKEKNT
jgi:hypothetical protein